MKDTLRFIVLSSDRSCYSQSADTLVIQFKDSPFTIVRPESIVTVLPKRYVNELHNVPDTKLNPIQAIVGVRGPLIDGLELNHSSNLLTSSSRI